MTRAGACASKTAHSHGGWQEALVPYHVGISTACLSVFTTQKLASLRAKNLKGNEQAGSCGAFHDLVFKVVHHPFRFVLFITTESLSLVHTQGEGHLFSIIAGKSIKKSVDV